MADKKDDILEAIQSGKAQLVSKDVPQDNKPDDILSAIQSGKAQLVAADDVNNNNRPVSRRPLSMQTANAGISPEQVHQNLSFINKNIGQYIGDVSGPNVVTLEGKTQAGNEIKRQYASIPGKGMSISEKRSVAPLDIDQYRTKLNPSEEEAFQKWKSKLPERLQGDEDYDIRGFFKENPNFDISNPEQHLTDKYKLPNHNTFSNESKYFNDKTKKYGGYWDGDNYIPYNESAKKSLQTGIDNTPSVSMQHVSSSLTKDQVEAGQQEVGKEIQASSDYIANDIKSQFDSQPEFLKAPLEAAGVNGEKFASKVTNPEGDVDALKNYAQTRKDALQQQMQQDIAGIPKPVLPSTGPANIHDQLLYDKQVKQVQDKYKQQEDYLSNAVFTLAAQKVVNKLVKRGVTPEYMEPYEIGADVEKVMGNENAVKADDEKWQRTGNIDPTAKVNREVIGYRAMQLASRAALANGDTPLAQALEKKSSDFNKKIIEDNPAYKRQQLINVLSDQVYKDQPSLYQAVTGYSVNQDDLHSAAKELGIPESDISDIKPEDMHRQSNFASRTLNSFIKNSAVPISEALMRHVVAPITRMGVLPINPITEDQLNDTPDNWWDNSQIGHYMGGVAPGASNVLGTGSKVETNPVASNYLMDVSDDNKRYNINAGSIANVLADGIGQIASYAGGGGELGSVIKGAGMLKEAEMADRVGLGLYGYITGYDRNKKQANQAIGNEPGSETKKIMLANIYTLSEVLSEQIFPDTKIKDQLFHTPAFSELANTIKTDGLNSLTKQSISKAFVEGTKEFLKNDFKEGAEEAVTVAGNALGDMIFAPKQYENTDYQRQALEQGALGAISAAIPVGAGAMAEIRHQGTLMKSAMVHVGENPALYIQQIDADLGAGKITEKEANAKKATVNKLSHIVNNEVPSVSLITDKPLSNKDKNNYANNLHQESIMQEQASGTNDDVKKKIIEGQIGDLQQQRTNILENAGADISNVEESKNDNNEKTVQAEKAEGQQDGLLTQPAQVSNEMQQSSVEQKAASPFPDLPEDWNEEDVHVDHLKDNTDATGTKEPTKPSTEDVAVQETGRTAEANEGTPVEHSGITETTSSERQQSAIVDNNTEALPAGQLNETEIPKKTTVDYATQNGNQKVYFENGALKVVNAKTGEEVSAPTAKKAISEAAKNYDFTQGEPATVAEENTPTGQALAMHVAENSNSPIELADIYTNEEPVGESLTGPEYAISQFGGFTTTNKSYNRFGDRNNMTRGKAVNYINESKGAGIDQIAQEISNHSGIEVTSQDVVDFMDRFPNGVKQSLKTEPSAVAQKAAERFEQITGFPLTPNIADEVYRQQLEKADAAEKAFLNQQYESEQQLDDEFWNEIAKELLANEKETGLVQQIEQSEQNATATDEGRAGDTAGTTGSIQETGAGTAEATEAGSGGDNPEPIDAGVNAPIVVNDQSGVMHIPDEATQQPQGPKDAYHQAFDDYNKYNGFVQAKEKKLEELSQQGKVNSDEYKRAFTAWRQYKVKMNDAQRIINRGNKEQVKKKADSIRKLKIAAPESGQIFSATPVAAAVKMAEVLGRNLYNAAVETVASALEAGYNIKVAVQKGVEYVNDRWFTGWPEPEFRDLMGENNLVSPAAPDVRALLSDNSGLSDKQRRNADHIVEQVNANKATLKTATDYIRGLTALSDATQQKIIDYIKGRVTNDIFKQTGEEWADKYSKDANGDYHEALKLLGEDVQTMIHNAENLQERVNIRQKEAAARTAIQSKMVDEGILDGSIKPAYSKEEIETLGPDKPFEPRKRTRKDAIQENTQDKYARLERMQEASTKPITTANDAVTAMRLKNSKAGHQIEEVQKYLGNTAFEKGSFFDRMKKDGIDLQDFGLYLYAKHAPERNAYNAELRQAIFEAKVLDLNSKIADAESQEKDGADARSQDLLMQMGEPLQTNAHIQKLREQLSDIINQKDPRFVKMPDGGSGMTNQQAKEIIDEAKANGDIDKYEKFEKEFKENVVDKILDLKYENGLIDEKTYNHLKSFYKNYVPLKVDLEEDDGTGTFRQLGKNGRDLYKSKGSVERTYAERNNPVLQAIKDLETSINTAENNKANTALANLAKGNPNEGIWDVVPAQYNILKDKEGKVLYSPEIMRPENGVPFYEDGKKSYVILKDPGLQNMIKKVGNEQFNKIIQWPTRLLTTVNTLGNPNFILKNPFIDIQDAALSLRAQDKPQVLKNFRSYYKKAPKLVWQIFKGDKVANEWKPWVEEWKQQGGEISFLHDIGDDKKAKRTLDLFDNYGKPLSKSQVANYTQGFKHFAGGLEQMTRVMAYRAAREAGVAPEKAALISRNATVDFEKKGVYGTYINAFKAFANAGIQGTGNLLYLAKKSRKVQKFLGALVIGGIAETIFNNLVSECDPPGNPDCYWEKPEWEKSKSFNIPMSIMGGSGILNIPAGRQFAWFKYAGNNIAEVALGRKEYGKAFADMASAFANFYNPVGGDAPPAQQIAGNAAPVVQVASNQNSLGTQIWPDNDKGVPDHESYFPSTPHEYVTITDELSNMTGGGKGKEGLIDVSPNTLSYIANTLGGGLYQFGFQGYKTLSAPLSDDKLESKNIPFVNIFYREPHMAKSKQLYYSLSEESKKEVFSHKKHDELKEVLDRLVESGEITPEQRGKRFNYIERNQTEVRKRKGITSSTDNEDDD
jgi:hypothetical protein